MYGMHCCLFLHHGLAYHLEAMYAYGILENVVYRVKAVEGYALTVIGILLDVFMDKQYGSIISIHPEHNVISYVMSYIMEMVLRFRVVVHCDVWESLIAHGTQMTVNIMLHSERDVSKIWFHYLKSYTMQGMKQALPC